MTHGKLDLNDLSYQERMLALEKIKDKLEDMKSGIKPYIEQGSNIVVSEENMQLKEGVKIQIKATFSIITN